MPKTHKVPKGKSRKLWYVSGGPFIIAEKGPNFTYILIQCSYMRPLKSVINAVNLRRYHDPKTTRQDLSYKTENQPTEDKQDSSQPNQEQQDDINPQVNQIHRAQRTNFKPLTDESKIFKIILKGRFRNGQCEFRIEWESGKRTWESDTVFSDEMLQDINRQYTVKGDRQKYTK